MEVRGHHEQENSKEETEQTALTTMKAITETTNCTFRAKKVEGHDHKNSPPPLSLRHGVAPLSNSFWRHCTHVHVCMHTGYVYNMPLCSGVRWSGHWRWTTENLLRWQWRVPSGQSWRNVNRRKQSQSSDQHTQIPTKGACARCQQQVRVFPFRWNIKGGPKSKPIYESILKWISEHYMQKSARILQFVYVYHAWRNLWRSLTLDQTQIRGR